jgi:hypothetical protein
MIPDESSAARKLSTNARWDEGEGRSPITDGVKLPVINALYGAITVDKEIDLEEA